MASETPTPPDTQCRPCKGSGRVISGLGGELNEVTCPWCGGSGEFDPERNAQQAGIELRGDAPDAAEAPAGTAAAADAPAPSDAAPAA